MPFTTMPLTTIIATAAAAAAAANNNNIKDDNKSNINYSNNERKGHRVTIIKNSKYDINKTASTTTVIQIATQP